MCLSVCGRRPRSTSVISIIFKYLQTIVISDLIYDPALPYSVLLQPSTNQRQALLKFFVFIPAFVLLCISVNAQQADSLHQHDSLPAKVIYRNIYSALLDSNYLLNTKGTPTAYAEIPAKHQNVQFFFYIMAGLLLCLGLMRTFFSRYFNTLFRVFFNTSLRQNQLTDQLTQAKLPSFLFNAFFVVNAGIYVYFLVNYFLLKKPETDWKLLQVCILTVAGCYFIKFITLRFMGWITGYRREADAYIFIIFLFNKIEGILLLPFSIVIIFSMHSLAGAAVFISVLLLAVILIVRFFRSWSLLQNNLKVSAFHFMMYIFALEILPIAFIYKAVKLFLGINQ